MIDDELFGNNNRSEELNGSKIELKDTQKDVEKTVPKESQPTLITENKIDNQVNIEKETELTISKNLSTKREKYAEKARNILDDENTVFIGIETTGSTEINEICHLVILNSKEEVLFDKMFKANHTMNPKSSDRSGITDEMLKNESPISQYKDELNNLLKDKNIVTGNMNSDLKILSQTSFLENFDFDYKAENFINTETITGGFYDTNVQLKKSEIMSALNIPHNNEHKTLIENTKNSISILKKIADYKPDDDYKDIIDVVPENKVEKIQNEREQKAIQLERKPSYQKYLDEFNKERNAGKIVKSVKIINADIMPIATKFNVTVTTVKTQLLKAIYDEKLPVTNILRIMQTTPEVRERANKALTELGIIGSDCFEKLDNKHFSGQEIGFLKKENLTVAHLYEAALYRETGFKDKLEQGIKELSKKELRELNLIDEPPYQKYLDEFNDNKSIDEIAEEYGVKKETVKENLIKAMKKEDLPEIVKAKIEELNPPKYQRYLNEFNNNKNIDEIAEKFGVQKGAVQINLLRAMQDKKMPVTDIMQTPLEIKEKADNALTELGYTKDECFIEFHKNYRFNYERYNKFASENGITVAQLYEAALNRELEAKK